MTYAMWGILAGMALMFGVSFYRYAQPVEPGERSHRSAEALNQDRLRERYGL